MLNPRHPGQILRDDLAAAGLRVTERAARLGCTRQALSRLLNDKAGLFEAVASAERAKMVVRAGDLHGGVGGYPGTNHRMPLCRDVRYAELVEGDEVLSALPSGRVGVDRVPVAETRAQRTGAR